MKVAGLKRKAISIANKSKDAVVLGVFKNLIKSHNEFCDCEYCDILKKYVTLKKAIPRLSQRAFEFDDRETYDQLVRRKELIKVLKKQKDSLKVKAIQELS